MDILFITFLLALAVGVVLLGGCPIWFGFAMLRSAKDSGNILNRVIFLALAWAGLAFGMGYVRYATTGEIDPLTAGITSALLTLFGVLVMRTKTAESGKQALDDVKILMAPGSDRQPCP